MDVTKYDFSCQKALHQGLQFAKSLGHRVLEVEHVAFALVRSDALTFEEGNRAKVVAALQTTLGQMPKNFGEAKIAFGKRLDLALDFAETKAQGEKVSAVLMWEALQKQSSTIKVALAKILEEQVKQGEFEPLFSENHGQPSSSGTDSKESQLNDSGSKPPKRDLKIEDSIKRYTTDFSELAERGELDPVIGRDAELRRVLEIVGRKKKNNPILLGEPGVGKSAIAEALAIKIAAGKVPESMRHKRVLSLDLASLLAGARYRGEFEERLKNLLKALKEIQGKVILFIDEIHMLVGAGSTEGSTDAANIMKPALARGEIQALGATTLAEYRRYIEKDPALERRFQPLIVEEPTKSVAISILRGLKSKYEIHHAVRISDDAINAAVNLSIRYLTQRRLPDKAIDLIDEAASKLRLQIDSVPAVLDDLNARIAQLEMEKNGLGKSTKNQKAMAKIEAALAEVKKDHAEVEAIWRGHQACLLRLKTVEKEREELAAMFEKSKQNGDFAFASQLQFEAIPRVEKQLIDIRKELELRQRHHNFLGREVGEREIADVVSVWSGIPVGKLLEDDAEKVLSIETRLSQRIFGQQNAVDRVSRAVKRAKVGINDPKRPQAVFLFLGPTGVGKTELAKAIAAEVFSDESKLIRIDMSEYMEAHNVARLIGAPPGYVGFGDGGELTEAVKNRPHSVILFDEIEKAHPKVLDILLQLLDEGRLTDAKGRLFDFRHTFIVLTSNLPLYASHQRGATDLTFRRELSEHLRPELVNRIDDVVVFNKLSIQHLEALIVRLLAELNTRLAEREFRVSLGVKLTQQLVQVGLTSDFGGRALRRAFESLVIDHVSDRILSQPHLCAGAWQAELDGDGGVAWQEDFGLHRFLPPARHG